jgi:hypothetical protein
LRRSWIRRLRPSLAFGTHSRAQHHSGWRIRTHRRARRSPTTPFSRSDLSSSLSSPLRRWCSIGKVCSKRSRGAIRGLLGDRGPRQPLTLMRSESEWKSLNLTLADHLNRARQRVRAFPQDTLCDLSGRHRLASRFAHYAISPTRSGGPLSGTTGWGTCFQVRNRQLGI